MQDPTDLPPKKEKRINDLIKSGRTAIVLTIISLVTGPLGILLMAVGWLYYFETGWLLKKFDKELPKPLKRDLKQARTRYFWMGMVTLIWYGLFALLIAVLVLASE